MGKKYWISVVIALIFAAYYWTYYSNLATEPANEDWPTAEQIASEITMGWNIGNTLESTDGHNGGETAWGNPQVTPSLIDSVKAAGFNAIRIPCAWNMYIDNQQTWHISDQWMARVKEVARYCTDRHIYTIINIHWDGGWLEENPTADKKDSVNMKQHALWTQIANAMKDFNEYLLFAGANEIRKDYNTPDTINLQIAMSYLQTFVDAVRATGGNNLKRTLIVQSYNTSASMAQWEYIPHDTVDHRMMLEVHYYDPYPYTLADDNNATHYWGEPYKTLGTDSWGQEDHMRTTLDSLGSKFTTKGMPVIIGEYGATRRSNDARQTESRAYWYKTFNRLCKDNRIKTFAWDTGSTDSIGMGFFDRNTGAIVDSMALNAIIEGTK